MICIMYCFLSQTVLYLRDKKKSRQRVLVLGSSQMRKLMMPNV